ncbi:MAG TPA: hypothetical protein VN516_04630 [Candidatus Baltobacteraceae bacterium]|nr:hypothetical protein [Candidatus Baltobacteraceae bacterium]
MLKSHELIGFMSPALASDILNFAYETDKPTYKATMNGVATALRVRPVYLERQPRAQRHISMVQILSKPGLDAVAGGLIRAWLVQKHKAMLIDFLNTLGIQNKDGVVDDLPKEIDDAKLKTAVEQLLSKYQPEVVAVYLNAFNDMNEANWANLKAMLEADSRLQLGNHG